LIEDITPTTVPLGQYPLSYSSFNPNFGIRLIRDPIHSYIPITKEEKSELRVSAEHDILQNEWLQRLRRIKQTQVAYTVFPGLEHSRFAHALGVMHLAGKMARKWYGHVKDLMQPAKIDTTDDALGNETYPVEYVEEIFRLAGLLHDVGHGPHSHSLDQAYARYFRDEEINHEYLSALIIDKKFTGVLSKVHRSPNGKFDEEVDPGMLSWLVRPDYRKYKEPRYVWLGAMRSIISGPYDADAIDYISRDSHHAGLPEYGLLDIDRFVENTFFVVDGVNLIQCLNRNSLPAFEHLLMSRYQMYETCYYNKDVRAFELKTEELLVRTLEKKNLPNPKSNPDGFLEMFLGFDEYTLLGESREWKVSADEKTKRLGDDWEEIALRKHGMTLAYNRDHVAERKGEAGMLRRHLVDDYKKRLEKSVEEWKTKDDHELEDIGFSRASIAVIRNNSGAKLLDEITFDSPYLDLRRGINPEAPLGTESIYIYDSRNPETLDTIRIADRVKRLPVAFLPLRAYVRKSELKEFVGKALEEVYKML
jgi:hypothetical protein